MGARADEAEAKRKYIKPHGGLYCRDERTSQTPDWRVINSHKDRIEPLGSQTYYDWHLKTWN
jgi:hypothetical protein